MQGLVIGCVLLITAVYRIVKLRKKTNDIPHEDLLLHSKVTVILLLLGGLFITFMILNRIFDIVASDLYYALFLITAALLHLVIFVIIVAYRKRSRRAVLRERLNLILLSKTKELEASTVVGCTTTSKDIKLIVPENFNLDAVPNELFTNHPLYHLDKLKIQSFFACTGKANEFFQFVFTDEDSIWVSKNGRLEDFKQIDLSVGIPEIPTSTIRTLECMVLLYRNAPVFGYTFWSTPTDFLSLHNYMREMSDAFAILQNQIGDNSSQRSTFVEEALRELARDTFDLTAQIHKTNIHPHRRINQEVFANTLQGIAINMHDVQTHCRVVSNKTIGWVEPLRKEAWSQADVFIDVFINSFKNHGSEKAFDIAWSVLNAIKR